MSALRRTDLQARAQSITESAILLVKNHRWSDAYYLAGYAVELGLKACIAKQLSPETIPDKEFLKNILKHEFDLLIGLAGLRQELKEELRGDSVFAANWAIVGEWSTDRRYEAVDPTSAQLFVSAVADSNSGVLEWIKRFW